MDEAEESTKNHKGLSIINISIVAIPSIDTSKRLLASFCLLLRNVLSNSILKVQCNSFLSEYTRGKRCSYQRLKLINCSLQLSVEMKMFCALKYRRVFATGGPSVVGST